jgi:hypothetical protein
MRGLWDNEQPVSPSLRSSWRWRAEFLGLDLRGHAFLAVGSVVAKHYVVAGLQLAFGIAIPFAIWLGLRMMADILVALNRSHDRLEGIEDALSWAGAAGATTRSPQHAGGRARQR